MCASSQKLWWSLSSKPTVEMRGFDHDKISAGAGSLRKCIEDLNRDRPL